MDSNFRRAISRVLKHEGGYVDHPEDPGGATNKGVTLATFRRYVNPKGTKADLRAITGLGHGFLRQFGALFLSERGVEHELEEQRDVWRDGGHGPVGARSQRW